MEYFFVLIFQIYLGANKVRNHLKKYPTHELKLPKKIATDENRNSLNTSSHLFDVLLDKIERTTKNERIQFLLNELSDFVGKLDCLRSQLMSATDSNSTIQYLNKNVSRAFGMEPGNYHMNTNVLDELNLDFSAISSSTYLSRTANLTDDPPIFDAHAIVDVLSSNTNHPPIEYNLNISLDSISDSKIMNLPEGMSDESLLLQTVEELVKERIQRLPEDTLTTTVVSGASASAVASFDHINDNAVEAAVGNRKASTESNSGPVLDLSLDLFRFHAD